MFRTYWPVAGIWNRKSELEGRKNRSLTNTKDLSAYLEWIVSVAEMEKCWDKCERCLWTRSWWRGQELLFYQASFISHNCLSPEHVCSREWKCLLAFVIDRAAFPAYLHVWCLSARHWSLPHSFIPDMLSLGLVFIAAIEVPLWAWLGLDGGMRWREKR